MTPGMECSGHLRARVWKAAIAPAFTLTEMMVVLVIIGLIAAIVGPRLFNRLDTAKQRTAHLQIENLASAVNLFRIDTGRLPTRDEGLDVLVHAPADGTEWLGPYLTKDRVPLDPWGRPYVYDVDPTGARFTIVSYGGYGHPGGTGADKPISSDDENGRGPVQAPPPAISNDATVASSDDSNAPLESR
jgi:general secretion pathway protein G